MSWKITYTAYKQGKDPFKTLPLATAYRHRSIIQRLYGVDIKERNFSLPFYQTA